MFSRGRGTDRGWGCMLYWVSFCGISLERGVRGGRRNHYCIGFCRGVGIEWRWGEGFCV